MHSVTVDRANNLVEVKMNGFFSVEDGSWLGEDVRSAVRSLGSAVGQHLTLYDATDMTVQPTATVDAMVATFSNPTVRSLWARKVAFVSKSTLLRMQIQKLLAVREIGIFEDRGAALKWLLA